MAKMKQKSSASSSNGAGEDAPVVRHRTEAPPMSEQLLHDEEVPVVKWKKPVLPSDDDSSGSAVDELGTRQKSNLPAAGGDVPVIKWKKPVVPSDEESSVSDEPAATHRRVKMPPPDQDVPVVKWKKSNVPAAGGDVPVIKWKKPVVPSDEESVSDEPAEPTATHRRVKMPPPDQDVPVVKWKKPVIPSDEESLESFPEDLVGKQRQRNLPPSGGAAHDVPVVKWKKPVMPSDEESLESAPGDTLINLRGREAPASEDVPIVKWKKPLMPSDEESLESLSEDAVPNRRRLKAPPRESLQDVPVVKWKKPVMPSDEDSIESLSVGDPVSKEMGRAGDDDIPVVKWKKPVMPSSQEPPSGKPSPKGVKAAAGKARGTARLSPQSAAAADVPVVKWKAKSPRDSPVRNSTSPESLDTQNSANKTKTKKAGDSMPKQQRPVKKDGLKLPADSKRKVVSPEGPEARRYKVKMPADSSTQQQQQSKLGGAGGKAKSRLSPQTHGSNVGKQPSPTSTLSKNKELQFASARKNKGKESPSVSSDTPPDFHRESRRSKQESINLVSSELASPTRYPSTDDVTSYKSSSRRSSFSDSRSPSPPSIDPHIRMAINSPVTRRRTPSPARAAAAAGFSRLSSGQSPVFHQKQLQRLNQGLPRPGGMGLSSIGSSKLRGPKSGLMKGGSPVKGLASSSGDKRRRQLPAFPDSTAGSTSPGGLGRGDSYEGLVTSSTRLVLHEVRAN